MQSGAAIVKPGGTGTPRFVISARLAPLPPSVAFISRPPSAVPFPKKKTCRVTSASRIRGGSAPAAESQLVRVGRGRGRIIAREAGVAETAGAARYCTQHAVQRQVGERVHADRHRD